MYVMYVRSLVHADDRSVAVTIANDEADRERLMVAGYIDYLRKEAEQGYMEEDAPILIERLQRDNWREQMRKILADDELFVECINTDTKEVTELF